jgi:hypothetical protein
MVDAVKPGRNDPCRCGSGKKYKNCCLAAEQQLNDSPQGLAWARVRRAIDGLPALLGSFVFDVYGPDAVEEAWDDFTCWDGPAFDGESPLMTIFMPWLFHAWEPEPLEEVSVVDVALRGRTPTSVFLEQHPQLDPVRARYLRACLEAPFSFHEVLRCDVGRGFRTRDLLTREEHEVLEQSATEGMTVGDVLYCQLVPIDGIVILEACSPYALAPIDKVPIIELRERMEGAPATQHDFGGPLQNWAIEIRELYLALIERFLDIGLPLMENTDGEILQLQRVVFDVDDAERVLSALVQAVGGPSAEVERSPDGRLERARFSWIRPGDAADASSESTVLGEVELTATRLVAHVNSDERAEAFCDLVDQVAATVARFRDIELLELSDELEAEDFEHADAEIDDEGLDLSAVPEVREHLAEIVARHYADWETHELDVFGGARPIDVMQRTNGPEKVEAVIEDMERHARASGPEGSVEALARLRERLGLARR